MRIIMKELGIHEKCVDGLITRLDEWARIFFCVALLYVGKHYVFTFSCLVGSIVVLVLYGLRERFSYRLLILCGSVIFYSHTLHYQF